MVSWPCRSSNISKERKLSTRRGKETAKILPDRSGFASGWVQTQQLSEAVLKSLPTASSFLVLGGLLHMPRNVSSIGTTLDPLQEFCIRKSSYCKCKYNLNVPSDPREFLLVAPGGWKGYYSFPHVNSGNILFEKALLKEFLKTE